MAIKGFWFGEDYVRVPDSWDEFTFKGRRYVRRRDEQGKHQYWVHGDGSIVW